MSFEKFGYPHLIDVEACNGKFLCKFYCEGQSNISESDDGDIHRLSVWCKHARLFRVKLGKGIKIVMVVIA